MSQIQIITHPSCSLHEMGEEHPESPKRIKAIKDLLLASDLSIDWQKATQIAIEQLEKVHDPNYIHAIFKSAPKYGYTYLGPDVTMNASTLESALYAAGSVINAVDNVFHEKAQKVFCLVRPPGHHAEYKTPMGFCFFNNLACGVIHALNHYPVKRIAIVDFDVHHGNGTEDIIKDRQQVLLCSSFQHPFYPFSPVLTKHHYILHLPLPPETDGTAYRKKFEATFLPRIEEFKPEILFVSAGFDGHRLDPVGGLNLVEDDYAWLGSTLAHLAEKHCNNRIISVLEGGYNLDALAESVYAYLKAQVEIEPKT